MSLLVLVNPGSRANRRDPGCAERFAKILGDAGRVACPASLDRLAGEARRAAAESPSLIAIHGGDGTLHRTLSALIAAYAARPLPPIAILTGGTMNVVASSLGIRAPAEEFLAEIVTTLRSATPLTTLPRRCLQVGELYGFIFGNGLLSNFLEEYYARGSYGAWRALWVVLHTLASLLTTGRYARRIFRSFRGLVEVDGAPLPRRQLTGLGAATVTEIGFRLKLHHRADDDPDRMGGLAIHGGALSLLLDLLDVRLGRGLSPKRATSFVARHIAIAPDAPEFTYTLDGDLYTQVGRLTVQVGPVLHIVRPLSC
ncbi:MAG: diacylglycerol kinase family protein [Polyangia bacterium]